LDDILYEGPQADPAPALARPVAVGQMPAETTTQAAVPVPVAVSTPVAAATTQRSSGKEVDGGLKVSFSFTAYLKAVIGPGSLQDRVLDS